MRRPAGIPMRIRRQTAGYLVILAASFLVALVAAWTPFAAEINGAAYDRMARVHVPSATPTSSIILAIDELSLRDLGGMRRLRYAVAQALDQIAPHHPRVVALDLILTDTGEPADDARLEQVLRRTHNLVLASDIVPGHDQWEEPLARFRPAAACIGHVHAGPEAVCRQIELEKAAAHDRRWALALEAYRLARGGPSVLESPTDLEIEGVRIPAARADARALWVRYLPPSHPVPSVSLIDLRDHPELTEKFRNQVVFVGFTAQSAARDRLMTPFGSVMSGVEIHANAYETLARAAFLTEAPDRAVLAFALFIVAAAGLVFALRSGLQAYALGFLILMTAHTVPYLLFTRGTVFPYFTPVSVAWLSVACAASYQHFVIRRQLRRSESEKVRYQQAIHFVTHEMRTPLTAIQGSSELMTRYNLNDDKRKQIAQMINSESRRLARMIETFLNVERLSDGQLELRREAFPLAAVVEACAERARPLAERKQIRLQIEPLPEASLIGDRELMEYAVYNLLNNAIKYSPAETIVTVSGAVDHAHVRLSVRDQGIGMDEKELRNIFQKFYRTKRAEASGEAGTGIGLSIVEQIVTHHGGKIEVSSEPGRGSCFTVVLPLEVRN
jgi:signal transduction histidine kinase